METQKKTVSMWWPSSPRSSSVSSYTNKHLSSSHVFGEQTQPNAIDELGAMLWPQAKYSTEALQRAPTHCKHNYWQHERSQQRPQGSERLWETATLTLSNTTWPREPDIVFVRMSHWHKTKKDIFSTSFLQMISDEFRQMAERLQGTSTQQ